MPAIAIAAANILFCVSFLWNQTHMEPCNTAIIPARGGSKGLPRKNIADFCGRPLIAWSIEQALSSKSISSVFVSTDDEEIARIAEAFGARTIQRPPALATDTASSESALLHALDAIEAETPLDLTVFLQATAPLRMPEDIDRAVHRFRQSKADSLFSCSVLEDCCLWEHSTGRLRALTYDPKNRGRRQDRSPLYLENGSLYVFRPDLLRRTGNRLGGTISVYETAPWQSYEIDTEADREICEYFFRKKILPLVE